MKIFELFGRPRTLRTFHLVSTVTWGLLIPATIFTDLKGSITWIALMSVWANFVGHFSSYQASRVEVAQDDMIKNQDESSTWQPSSNGSTADSSTSPTFAEDQ